MSLDQWAAFAAACAVFLFSIPGPTILLVCSYALSAGRRAALWMVLGVAMGDLVAMTTSVLGLGALLLSSAELFTALRLLGAAYLVYLGWRLWNAPVQMPGDVEASLVSGPKMAAHVFAVTAFNPQSIVFFIAFVPQFLDASAPLGPQFAAMIPTFVGMAALNALAFALLADRMRRRITRPGVLRMANRIGGGALMAMGAAAAFLKRN